LLGYEEDIPTPLGGTERGERERESERPLKDEMAGYDHDSLGRESAAGVGVHMRSIVWFVGLDTRCVVLCCVVVLCYHGFSFFLWYLLTLIPLRMDEYEAGMLG
jgi:hypothetical protein